MKISSRSSQAIGLVRKPIILLLQSFINGLNAYLVDWASRRWKQAMQTTWWRWSGVICGQGIITILDQVMIWNNIGLAFSSPDIFSTHDATNKFVYWTQWIQFYNIIVPDMRCDPFYPIIPFPSATRDFFLQLVLNKPAEFYISRRLFLLTILL